MCGEGIWGRWIPSDVPPGAYIAFALGIAFTGMKVPPLLAMSHRNWVRVSEVQSLRVESSFRALARTPGAFIDE